MIKFNIYDKNSINLLYNYLNLNDENFLYSDNPLDRIIYYFVFM